MRNNELQMIEQELEKLKRPYLGDDLFEAGTLLGAIAAKILEIQPSLRAWCLLLTYQVGQQLIDYEYSDAKDQDESCFYEICRPVKLPDARRILGAVSDLVESLTDEDETFLVMSSTILSRPS